jgi:hypothetical protein
MICVRCAPTYAPERKYILEVVLREFLGLDFRVEVEDRPDWRLNLDEAPESGAVFLPDVLFQTPKDDWLSPTALPKEPLLSIQLGLDNVDQGSQDEALPVLYGVTGAQQAVLHKPNEARLAVDVFGSAFFMLTRYEELVQENRYPYERFPAHASLAQRAGFLERPLVNEYVELLWEALHPLWPQLPRKQRAYRVWPTHDVDTPFAVLGRKFPAVLRSAGADILRRHDSALAWQRLQAMMKPQGGKSISDPFWTFEKIMDCSEAHGLMSCFFLLVDPAAFALDDPRIVNLLKQIKQRGHEIGVHPALDTHLKPEAVLSAKQVVERAMQLAGVEQESLGGRQHFLQWTCPDTWQAYSSAGLEYDSSLGFADCSGFRCGTCYEYPVFDLRTRQQLPLRERPLTVMEVSLFHYEKLCTEDALRKIDLLKAQCRKHHGDFTILWHNSELYNQRRFVMYEQAIWP